MEAMGLVRGVKTTMKYQELVQLTTSLLDMCSHMYW